MGEGLPADWRERFVAMVAGREVVRPEWFTGGPALSPAEQGAVYPEQYRLRLHGGLRAELPGLVAWDPERRDWDAVFSAYLRAHPATSWTLNRVADAFPGWFAGAGGTVGEVEMARLDGLVSRAFEAADAAPLPVPPPERVRLAPAVGLLRASTSVHAVRHAVLTGAPAPDLVTTEVGVVVWRREREVRHWVPPPELFRILEAIGAGASLGDAVAAPVVAGALDVAALAAALPGWMSEVAARGLLAP